MYTLSTNFEEINRDMDKENARKSPKERDRRAEMEAKWELQRDFGVALAEEYASHLPEATQKLLFDKAWSDSHSEGYHSVESTYEDLIDLADSILSHR